MGTRLRAELQDARLVRARNAEVNDRGTTVGEAGRGMICGVRTTIGCESGERRSDRVPGGRPGRDEATPRIAIGPHGVFPSISTEPRNCWQVTLRTATVDTNHTIRSLGAGRAAKSRTILPFPITMVRSP